jgi:hypothetical protein
MQSSDNHSEQSQASVSARVMWFIALLLAVGALSLVTSALPGRAKPLFLLPFVFGIAAAGLSVVLRRSLTLPCSVWPWLVTVSLALGGYGQVVASAFREYGQQVRAAAEADGKALIAIQMLKESSAEHRDLAERMQADLEARTVTWGGFLSRRYAAVGGLTGRKAEIAFSAELLLVIAGVGLGRRMLDARRVSCQAELL